MKAELARKVSQEVTQDVIQGLKPLNRRPMRNSQMTQLFMFALLVIFLFAFMSGR